MLVKGYTTTSAEMEVSKKEIRGIVIKKLRKEYKIDEWTELEEVEGVFYRKDSWDEWTSHRYTAHSKKVISKEEFDKLTNVLLLIKLLNNVF